MGVHDSLQDEGEGLHRGTCTLCCVQSSLDLDRRKANAEPDGTRAEMRNARKIICRPGCTQPLVVRRLHGRSEY